MGDRESLILALVGLIGFATLAVLGFVALRVEQAHRASKMPPPVPPRCTRLHASDALEGILARERAACDEHLLAAEDLPAFRGPVRPWVDDEEQANPVITRHR